jgi:5-hydroxyisourate hydrolase-like protein (transthyretin family)
MIDRKLGIFLAALVLVAIATVTWWVVHDASNAPFDDPVPAQPTASGQVTPLAPAIAPAPAPLSKDRSETGLLGVVLQPDGRPAAGTTVTLFRQQSAWPEWRREPIESVETGGDGAFAFATPRAPHLLVGFEHPDFAGDVQEAPASLRELVLHLQRGFDVEGIVTNDAGLPMPNVRVSLESTLVDERVVSATDTSSAGRFRFRNVAMGTMRVVARHEWWQPAVLANVVVGSFVRTLELRFSRPALALEGRVMSSATQEPVAGALVLALPPVHRLGRNEPATTTTLADGSFRLAGLARGVLRLEVRHPDYATVGRSVAVGSGFAPQTFDLLPRGEVRGRLDAADSELFQGAVLTLRSAVDELVTTEVQADGSFVFSRTVTPGAASLSVAGGRFAFASGSSVLTIKVEEAGVPLVLDVLSPAIVTARVVDAAGLPIAGARITAPATGMLLDRLSRAGNALLDRNIGKLGDQLTRSAAGEPEPLLAVTDDKGRFRVAGLAPGAVTLRAAREGYGSSQVEVVMPLCGETLEAAAISLPDGCRIRGRVQRGGRPMPGVQVGVVVDGLAVTAVTGLDGTYELVDLLPGEYRVSARYSTFPSVKARDAAKADARTPVVVDLELPAGRTIRGIVTGTDGQPVEGAVVLIRGEQVNPVLCDSNGVFELEAPNREVELVVGQSDRGARKIVPVKIGDDRVNIAIEAMPDSTVTARVLGLPGRRAIPGVLMRVARDAGDAAASSRWLDLDSGNLRNPLYPAGKSTVVFWAEGYAPVAREVEVAAGQELDLGELLLEPGCVLRGVVRDEQGRPIAAAEVFLGEESDFMEYQARTRSDERGEFEVRGVSSAAATLLVRAQGYAWKAVPLRLPADVLAEDRLAVCAERGSAIEVKVAGRDVEGSMLVLRRGGRVVATAEVDDNGVALFQNRGPGDYVVQRFGDEAQQAIVQVRGSGEVLRAEL